MSRQPKSWTRYVGTGRLCQSWKWIKLCYQARLAQSVEHETLNLRVVGSSPTLGDHLFCKTLPLPGHYSTCGQKAFTSLAPWLSWLKRLSSKQEIPSSNLGGALATQYFFLFSHSPLAGSSALMTNSAAVAKCRDPGSNRGPLDLQSNALPTELSRPLLLSVPALASKWKTKPELDGSKE